MFIIGGIGIASIRRAIPATVELVYCNTLFGDIDVGDIWLFCGAVAERGRRGVNGRLGDADADCCLLVWRVWSLKDDGWRISLFNRALKALPFGCVLFMVLFYGNDVTCEAVGVATIRGVPAARWLLYHLLGVVWAALKNSALRAKGGDHAACLRTLRHGRRLCKTNDLLHSEAWRRRE